jgi:hypothetical protein
MKGAARNEGEVRNKGGGGGNRKDEGSMLFTVDYMYYSRPPRVGHALALCREIQARHSKMKF